MKCTQVNALVGLDETLLEEGVIWLPNPTWFHSSNADNYVVDSTTQTKSDLPSAEEQEEDTERDIWLPHPNWLRPADEDLEEENEQEYQ